MTTSIDKDILHIFLSMLGKQYPHPTRLILLGGSALHLLGNPRPTLDIDYVGDDLKKDDFQKCVEDIAKKLHLDVEAVPITQFMPFPPGEQERNLPVGVFGNVEVVILDPYVMALSKIERGFDTDIEDVLFLLQKGFVDLEKLEPMIKVVLQQAAQFDINSNVMQNHWRDLRNQL